MRKASMLTATEISEKSGIKIDIVRYRLRELKKSGKLKFKRFGQAYAYYNDTLQKVVGYSK